MALPENSIDAFKFITIVEQPQIVKHRLDVVQRPGTRGTALWDRGVKGQAFIVTTLVDEKTFPDARKRLGEYRDLIRNGAVEMKWRDHTLNSENILVAVLDVITTQIKAMNTMIGGLNVASGDSGFMLICQWNLIPIENNQPLDPP